MPAPPKVLQLIKVFQENADEYQAAGYSEAMLRQQFVNPLFKCLGWDMENEAGHAQAYMDVIHEAAIKIGGETKAPDYSFRIGGTPKFYLEAKKPAVNIREDAGPAFQLRRYAWTAKMPLSILTNFAEFAVYDSRVKPAQTDKASAARILILRYTDYDQEWDQIAGVFSREAVLKGSFDKYADTNKAKRGTATVDAAFLEEIESWREELAKNLALRNPQLSSRELNFAVQITIDRIIFLRMCEDRGIERYGQLRELLSQPGIYGQMLGLYRKADDRYNSGLFHFNAEKGRAESPDTLTPGLDIDDKVLRGIFKGLYFPDSPYEFAVLPVEILGQVYEQFLGKVIRLTTGHKAKIEEKPEVKKAGGVYYTPAYIVDYIVKHTVGKLLGQPGTASGISPKQAAKLKILDPACGSGSFLLGAYQYLLQWHLDQYLAVGPGKHKKELYQTTGGDWRLTTGERKRILLNNLYGVDIDPQAVEVTKLSLLLKVLEGESQLTLDRQLKLFRERALPDLADNIKCGNSLIGPDFFNGHQLSLFDDEERRRVNVFDWHREFAEIMKAGGFDTVIGNPPYIRIQTLREWAPEEVEHYKSHYQSAAKGNYDIYVVFVERGLQLLNSQGQLGFILPHKFFNAQYGAALRGLLSRGRHLSSIVHFGDQQVFDGATTYTCLMFLDKQGCDSCRYLKIDDLKDWQGERARDRDISAKAITDGEWNFAVGDGVKIFAKLQKLPTTLLDVAESMGQGIRTSANEVYVLDLISSKGNLLTVHSQQLGRNIKIERAITLPFLQGRKIKSFRILPSEKLVLFPYRTKAGQAELIAEAEMRRRFPKAFAYFQANRDYLRNREGGRFRGADWYAFGRVQNIDLMLRPKILVPDIADRASFALDEKGQYAFTSGYGITMKSSVAESPKYILGLLNSALLDFFLKRVSTTMRGGFFRYFTQFIEQLPIRCINFSDLADKRSHDRMVVLVEDMLALHEKLAAAKAAHDKTSLERQISATDRQIDRLVYELYGLTEAEIKIVEEATAK
ncbi:MAG: Eco57I restriction-modification methylase domain-containing protein [Pirellulaceae bacterium]